MAVNNEFVGRLDREIASLRKRIADRKRAAEQSPATSDSKLLGELGARLTHLEDMRKATMDQSHGG
jgi:hypothetical protein